MAYLTAGQHVGGCAGAMSYYTVAGEPPGQWAGKGAAALGLTGHVDPAVIGRLCQHNIGPAGELLVKRRESREADEREQAAVAAYQAAHPYASAVELAEVRAAERGQDPHLVPYFDLTVDVVKSVSVLHASYRVAARQARERGEQDQAAALDTRADEIEAALLDAARNAVAWLERHATYTRTGHHSARTGQWRDGDGLVASVFLHHISRDGDPHLHVHVAVWNRVQRADQADEKWRTLDSRSLHNQRLAVAAVTDRIVETRLSALGYAMVPRTDGNGSEVGGVSQDVMDLFSSRSRALTPELRALIGQYHKIHGKAPSKRTIWLLGQQGSWWLIPDAPGEVLDPGGADGHDPSPWPLLPLVPAAEWVCHVYAACSLAGAGSADRGGDQGDVRVPEDRAAAGGGDPGPAGPVAG